MAKQTLNARRLHLDIWQEPLRHRRGIAIATAIGEAIGPKGQEKRFFVEGERPILLGCLYNRFQNGKYSCAVITRNAHPRFTDYHDDSFPLMLPHDPNFLKLWLSDTPPDDQAIAELLKQPKIFTDLTVTPVKTYKDAVPRGEPELIHADEWIITS
jgi:putative SOS response-associated peptidase YedK